MPTIKPLGLNGASKIAVSGEKVANLLMNQGISKSKIVVTGWPRFDRLYQFLNNADLNRNIQSNNVFSVLYASDSSAHFGKNYIGNKMLESVFNAAEILKDRVRFGIRLRPGEQLNYYSNLTNWQIENVSFLNNKEDLYEQISHFDIVVGNNSTLQVEAMIMGKPIINLIQKDSPDWREYGKSGIAISVHDHTSLVRALNEITKNKYLNKNIKEAQEKYMSSWFYKIDGLSGERVAQVVIKLINDRKNQ